MTEWSETDESRNSALRQLWKMAKGRPRMRRLIRQAVGQTRLRYADTLFELQTTDNFTEFSLWLKGRPPEHEATEHYRQRFAGREVTLVDVGANAGIFSLPILTSAARSATAVFFEPNPAMVARLRNNIALNDAPGAKVIEAAVGDRSGSATLCFAPKNNLGEAKIGAPGDGAGSIDVAMTPLLDALTDQGITKIDLLKVDIEGFEDKALRPFLTSAPPQLLPREIYFEDAHSEHWDCDLIAILTAAGYVLDRRFGHNAAYALDATPSSNLNQEIASEAALTPGSS